MDKRGATGGADARTGKVLFLSSHHPDTPKNGGFQRGTRNQHWWSQAAGCDICDRSGGGWVLKGALSPSLGTNSTSASPGQTASSGQRLWFGPRQKEWSAVTRKDADGNARADWVLPA
ncbi:hypothetical protein F1880_008037 [Penicillium rolfsii]|nr:hypothetical protein F1880_008037 [Penicillium rolfsii]